MPIKLTNQMKVDTLHKLLEEYGKQIQWVKDLDFKIFYYTIVLIVGIVFWLVSNPPHIEVKDLILYSIFVLGGLSWVFVIRNNKRHS